MESFNYTENPYYPLPNKMRGSFCEFEEKNKTRFIEINNIKYDSEEFLRLKKINCLKESILGEYIDLIGEENINESFFLYKIQTYLGDNSIKDVWDFNEAISDYAQYGFSNFKDLMSFCEDKWGIAISDFVPIEETSIPQ